jgi:murein DD-endopeptidase MepM/ murein hydrolase activator NlpD
MGIEEKERPRLLEMKIHKQIAKLTLGLILWSILVTLVLLNNTASNTADQQDDTYEKGMAIASIPAIPAEEKVGDLAGPPDAPAKDPVFEVINGELRSGEGLDDSLKRYDLSAELRSELIGALSGVLDFKRLRARDCFSITLDENGELVRCVYESGPLSIFRVDRKEDRYIAERQAIPLEVKTVRLSVEIDSSIFATFTALDEDPKLVHEYASIFASKIDFNTESRPGDHIDLVFEKYFKEGLFVAYGRILYASYEQDDKKWEGYYYSSATAPVGYYDTAGEELGTSFLRSPIPFGRVTSGFSYRRKHPITKVTRPHLGIDLAAPIGTPVLAASDGKVIYLGRKGGFGKTIILKHAGGYQTHYGHLSRYGKHLRVGSRINQKDIIGYVGSTGLSTGPHLDYRISINGQFKNPFSLKFKPNHILSKTELEDFRDTMEQLAALIDSSDDPELLQVRNVVLSDEHTVFFL